jgi:hypothetical protein
VLTSLVNVTIFLPLFVTLPGMTSPQPLCHSNERLCDKWLLAELPPIIGHISCHNIYGPQTVGSVDFVTSRHGVTNSEERKVTNSESLNRHAGNLTTRLTGNKGDYFPLEDLTACNELLTSPVNVTFFDPLFVTVGLKGWSVQLEQLL